MEISACGLQVWVKFSAISSTKVLLMIWNRTFRINTGTTAISYNTTSFLFFTVLLLLGPKNHSLNSDDLVSQLIILRSQSSTGVIHLSNKLRRRILSIPVPRPFSSVIFFDSQKLHSEPEISLPSHKKEFLLLFSSFHTNNPHNKKLFFFDIGFKIHKLLLLYLESSLFSITFMPTMLLFF